MSTYAVLSPNESGWSDSDRAFGSVLKEIIVSLSDPAPAPAAAAAAAAAGGAGSGPVADEDEDEDEEAWNYEEPVAGSGGAPSGKTPEGLKPLDIGFSNANANANANADLSTVGQLNRVIINKNVKAVCQLILAGAQIRSNILAVLYSNWKSFTLTERKFCVALMEWLSDRLPMSFSQTIRLPDGSITNVLNIVKDISLRHSVAEYDGIATLLHRRSTAEQLKEGISRGCKQNHPKFVSLLLAKMFAITDKDERRRRFDLVKPTIDEECGKYPDIQAMFTEMSRSLAGGARKRRSTHRKNKKNIKNTKRNRKATRSMR